MVEKRDGKSLLYWLLMTLVIIVLFTAPFQRALFNGGNFSFERPIYVVILWSSIILFVMSLYLFRYWKLSDQRDILSLIIWLIPISHLISLLNAATIHVAKLSVYIHVIYSVFFLVGLYFTRSRLGLSVIVNSILLSGYVIVFYGFANWLGNLSYHDAIIEGNRITSVFQYPNTYAALLMGLFLSCLLTVTKSKKWYMVILHATMLTPIMLTFFLTLSRGGMVVFPILVVVYLIFQPWINQLLQLFYILLSTFIALTLVDRFNEIRFQLNEGIVISTFTKGWIPLVVISISTALIIYFIQKFLNPWLDRKLQSYPTFRWSNTIIPIIIVFIGLLSAYTLFGGSTLLEAMPDHLKKRIERISLDEYSVRSRTIFYNDSIKIVKDYPVTGAGGGAWSSLYQTYQSYPYTSSQIHNFFLQYLLEVGWGGFIVFMGIVVYIFIKFFRYFISQKYRLFEYKYILFLLMISSILIHSLIDFDMSYVFIGILVFLSLGSLASVPVKEIQFAAFLKKNNLNRILPVSMMVIAVLVIINSSKFLNANTMYYAALYESDRSGDYNKITEKLDKSLNSQPNHPDYVFTKVNLLTQMYEHTGDNEYAEEAVKILNVFKQKEPYNRQSIELEYSLYLSKGELENAVDYITKQIKIFPWDMNLYEKMIAIYFDLGLREKNQGIEPLNWDKALVLYNEILSKREQLQKSYQGFFKTTPLINLFIGQIYYFKNEYELSSTVLHTVLPKELNAPVNREIARWYIASLIKQDKNDEELYNLLISDDENELEKIEEILKY